MIVISVSNPCARIGFRQKNPDGFFNMTVLYVSPP